MDLWWTQILKRFPEKFLQLSFFHRSKTAMWGHSGDAWFYTRLILEDLLALRVTNRGLGKHTTKVSYGSIRDDICKLKDAAVIGRSWKKERATLIMLASKARMAVSFCNLYCELAVVDALLANWWKQILDADSRSLRKKLEIIVRFVHFETLCCSFTSCFKV